MVPRGCRASVPYRGMWPAGVAGPALQETLVGEPLKEMSVVESLEHSVLLTTLNGVPIIMEGAPVLEPIEHSVLEKPLDGGHMEGMFDLNR